ncbi:MAG: hypothetical protein NTW29_02605 [Bacteroidetes bacterium]|nr:hypothetical protein [Bacteroidota bacterium]
MGKRSIRLLFLLLLCNLLMSAHSQLFRWSDSTLKKGSYFRFHYSIILDGGECKFSPCYRANKELYDSLINFLKLHPQFHIEISAHTNHAPTDASGIHYDPSPIEAVLMKAELERLGIEANRITAKGYPNTRPIIDETVMRALSEEDRKQANFINRRMEIMLTKSE